MRDDGFLGRVFEAAEAEIKNDEIRHARRLKRQKAFGFLFKVVLVLVVAAAVYYFQRPLTRWKDGKDMNGTRQEDAKETLESGLISLITNNPLTSISFTYQYSSRPK